MATGLEKERILITADEVNCLIHSYLLESGLYHSAFNLRKETLLETSEHYGKHIPRGELVDLLFRALLYTEAEVHFKNTESDRTCKATFSLLERHKCSSDPSTSSSKLSPAVLLSSSATKMNGETAGVKRKTSPIEDVAVEKRAKRESNAMAVDSPQKADEAQSKAVTILTGHKTEVFVGAWNPAKPYMLATGSKDAIVKIWNVPTDGTKPGPPVSIESFAKVEAGDLTSLHWDHSGTYLAVGSYDGVLRICKAEGTIAFQHTQHKGPIFTTRFSSDGRWMVTASLDSTTCLWDFSSANPAEWKMFLQYKNHSDCCLDVVWLSDQTFATCGADGTINVQRTDTTTPLRTFRGHASEINQIQPNAGSTKLASCSDDTTTRIWTIKDHRNWKPEAESADAIIPGLLARDSCVVLTGHKHAVSAMAWCGPVSPGGHELVATSAFDHSARLWDSETGACLKVFNDHKKAVYTLSVDPFGQWLATGSGDGWIHLYDLKSENKDKKWSWYSGRERYGVFDLRWQNVKNGEIDRFAASLECRQVAIVDLNKITGLKHS